MGIEYYAFALFITALVCLIAILIRMLFGDVRRQRKLLDEKESKLLKLYQTVESIMDEFNDQAKSSMEEIKEFESRAAILSANLAAQHRPPPAPPPQPPARPPEIVVRESEERISPRSMKIDSSRIRAASEVLERAERMIRSNTQRTSVSPEKKDNETVFQRIIDETVGHMPVSVSEEQADQPKTTHNRILEMSAEGKTVAQIAKKLGITQNEVMLVIGLGKR